MDTKYLKLVLTDKIISINICEEHGLFYIIREFEESYGVLWFKYSNGSVEFISGWDYAHLSSARRKCKEFRGDYKQINKEALKKILASKNIMSNHILVAFRVLADNGNILEVKYSLSFDFYAVACKMSNESYIIYYLDIKNNTLTSSRYSMKGNMLKAYKNLKGLYESLDLKSFKKVLTS